VLAQPARGEGYRLNVDAFLLAREALAAGPVDHAIDLGAGVGPVGLTLLAMGSAARVTLVERDPLMASLARVNAGAFDRLATVIEAPVDAAGPLCPRASLVVMNPPFTPPTAGRGAPEPRRRAARHGELLPFLEATARLLAPLGRAFLIYPATSLASVLSCASRAGLSLRSLRPVHPSPTLPARVLLACLTAEPGDLSLDPAIFERDAAGTADPALADFMRGPSPPG
jgi:tRNA1(Val) A37 N6-methylase TrmN6